MSGQADSETSIKSMFMAKFNMRLLRSVANKMVDAGFKLECNDGKGKRYVKYKFSDEGGLRPVHVKH